MKGSVLERLGRGHAPEPFNWVTRAKIQSVMNEHYHRCKAAIDQHLEAYYGDRQASVFQRSGITATDSVDLFETQAAKLVGLLGESLKPFSRDAKAFQMIADMTHGFLSYVDLVVGRIGPRIDLEMRNLPKPENALPGAGKLWAESRARILDSLDSLRIQFGLPAMPAPVAVPAMEEVEPLPLDCEIEPEIDIGFEPKIEPEIEPEIDIAFGIGVAWPEEEPVVEPDAAEACRPLPLAQEWRELWTEIAVQLCTGELRPMVQGDLAGAMSQWLAGRGVEGAEAEVDECARRFWSKLAAARPVTSRLDQNSIDLALEQGDAGLDRLAWQSGSLRGDGFAAGGHAHSCNAEFRSPTAPEPPAMPRARPPGLFASRNEPARLEPAADSMRYQVSWSIREEPSMPAPGFDIG